MEAVTAIGDRPDLWVAAPADGEASQHVNVGICQWRLFPPCLLNSRRWLCWMRTQRSGDGKISEAAPDNLPVNAKAEAPNPTGMQPRVRYWGERGGEEGETESSDLAVHGKLRCFTRKSSRRAKDM